MLTRFDGLAIRAENMEHQPQTVVPMHREPASAERMYIENKIAAKRREIAKLANDIRWLTMELESA